MCWGGFPGPRVLEVPRRWVMSLCNKGWWSVAQVLSGNQESRERRHCLAWHAGHRVFYIITQLGAIISRLVQRRKLRNQEGKGHTAAKWRNLSPWSPGRRFSPEFEEPAVGGLLEEEVAREGETPLAPSGVLLSLATCPSATPSHSQNPC